MNSASHVPQCGATRQTLFSVMVMQCALYIPKSLNQFDSPFLLVFKHQCLELATFLHFVSAHDIWKSMQDAIEAFNYKCPETRSSVVVLSASNFVVVCSDILNLFCVQMHLLFDKHYNSESLQQMLKLPQWVRPFGLSYYEHVSLVRFLTFVSSDVLCHLAQLWVNCEGPSYVLMDVATSSLSFFNKNCTTEQQDVYCLCGRCGERHNNHHLRLC